MATKWFTIAFVTTFAAATVALGQGLNYRTKTINEIMADPDYLRWRDERIEKKKRMDKKNDSNKYY